MQLKQLQPINVMVGQYIMVMGGDIINYGDVKSIGKHVQLFRLHIYLRSKIRRLHDETSTGSFLMFSSCVVLNFL